jgi:uncharacterized protein (DUF362 family)
MKNRHAAAAPAGRALALRRAAALLVVVVSPVVLPLDAAFTPSEPANTPMGVAFGVNPGRVAWSYEPGATTWDGVTNSPGWWADANTHPEIVARMLDRAIASVGGASEAREAWARLFADFNRRHKRGDAGYRPGEKIAIKLNLNQARSHGDNGNASYIAPQLVLALLGQLVREVGAAPGDITFFDTSRNVPSTIFDPCTRAFPGVHFVDSTGRDGRERVRIDRSKPLYLHDGGGPIYFPDCITQATYLINVAGLKGHTLAGMTVCAKNHLGSIFHADGSSAARDLHDTITVRPGRGGPAQAMGDYNSLVDLNGHAEIGGKTLLFVVDALYATMHNEYRLGPACKWLSAPFNGRWTSSLLVSQDGVAIDSVALDFLRSEPTLAGIVTGSSVDNYLHAMAQPSPLIGYDPERDGRTLEGLGVHEHWNSAAEKKYSRNLGTGSGIELVSLPPSP